MLSRLSATVRSITVNVGVCPFTTNALVRLYYGSFVVDVTKLQAHLINGDQNYLGRASKVEISR